MPTGERYAFRLEHGQVTGVLGPRNRLEWRSADLGSLDYDADPSRVEWARAHLAEFDLTG